MKQSRLLKSSTRRLAYSSLDLLRFAGFKQAIFWLAMAEQQFIKTGPYLAFFSYCYHRAEFGLCTQMMEAFVDRFSRQWPNHHTSEQQHPSSVPEQELIESMAYFFEVVNAAGFRPFITFGTLLGYVRDKRFIPWDRDLDIGLFYDETDVEKLVQLLNDSRFNVTEYTGTEFSCKIKCRLPGGPSIDIAFFKQERDKLLTFGRLGNGDTVIRKRTPFQLADAVYYDVPIRIPENPEVFLTENYGDWQTPKKAYHQILDSQLTDYDSIPGIRYMAMAILLLHLQNKDKQAVAHYLDLFIKKLPEDPFWVTTKAKLYACNYLF